MKRTFLFLSINFLFLGLITANSMNVKTFSDKEIESYLSSQSLYWESLPYQWNEGAFIGNGVLGCMAYVDSIDNTLVFWLGRRDVMDHRNAPDRKIAIDIPNGNVFKDFPRLDIGRIKLKPNGRILGGNLNLDIYNGELTCKIQTDKGLLNVVAYTPRDIDVNIVEVNYTDDYTWEYKPGKNFSPRFVAYPDQRGDYKDNPLPILVDYKMGGSCTYPMLAGGDYAVYWERINLSNKDILFVSSENEAPAVGKSLLKAKEEVNKAKKSIKRNRQEVNKWWHQYWDQSLIFIPDKQLENFYNIQMYKLATTSSPRSLAMDNMGVFYKTTQWPGIWWNLNIQLCYMATLTTNRLEEGENYISIINDYFENIVKNSSSRYIGDFVWALHTYYSLLRYRGDSWESIKKDILPKAMIILEKYKPSLKLENGVYNLLNTQSPEYNGFKGYLNSNYNLGLLRWMLGILDTICRNTDSTYPNAEYWNKVFMKLHPYAIDKNGMRIASDQPVDMSHRHFSHLISFYPLRIQNMDDPKTRNLLKTSIDHWLTIDQGELLAGYSFTSAASLYAMIGEGDNVVKQLKHFLNDQLSSKFTAVFLPNTFYAETGGRNTTLETPLSAATAIANMLLQSDDRGIEVFPAIPSSWDDCSFKNLRAEGGFVLSGVQKNNKPEWISILSEKGEPCIINLSKWDKIYCLNNSNLQIKDLGNGKYLIPLKSGEQVILSDDKNCIPNIEIPSTKSKSYYGVKKNKNLIQNMDWPE